jgi:hypothetical protein
MVALGRVLLWMVVLVAPGGFLLVPVLAAASLHGSSQARSLNPAQQLMQDLRELPRLVRRGFARLQRYWTKS